MASMTTLDERFNVAVKVIQNLPSCSTIQPSNLTKLTFYGLYKQATLGPCNHSQPSLLNYVDRAKWDAWDRYRSMTKEQAMSEYINEIQKIVSAMSETEEIIEMKRLLCMPHETNQEQMNDINSLASIEKQEMSIMASKTEDDSIPQSPTDDTVSNDQWELPKLESNEHNSNSSSTLSSTTSTSSTPSSDVEELYDDPSDFVLANVDEIPTNNNHTVRSVASAVNSSRRPPRAHYTHPNTSAIHPSLLHLHNLSARTSHTASATLTSINNSRDQISAPYDQIQRAILKALNSLQQDINNISEQLGRLEKINQTRQQGTKSMAHSKSDRVSRWFPLAGLRPSVIAFVLFWPFVAFILMRLFLYAKTSNRFRRRLVLKM